MQFKLTKKHLYWWPVEIKTPDPARPGSFLTQKFKMQFLAMPADEARALAAEIEGLAEEEQAARQHEQILQVCRDWDGDVVDDDKKPVPFSAEALGQALQFSWFRIGLYRAYTASLTGEEARSKN